MDGIESNNNEETGLLARKIAKCDRLLKKKGKFHRDCKKLQVKRAEYVAVLGEITYRNTSRQEQEQQGSSSQNSATNDNSHTPPFALSPKGVTEKLNEMSVQDLTQFQDSAPNFNDSLAVFEFSMASPGGFSNFQQEEEDEDSRPIPAIENVYPQETMQEETEEEQEDEALDTLDTELEETPQDETKSSVLGVVKSSSTTDGQQEPKEQQDDTSSDTNNDNNNNNNIETVLSGLPSDDDSASLKGGEDTDPVDQEDNETKDSINSVRQLRAMSDTPSPSSRKRSSWKPKSPKSKTLVGQIEPANLDDDCNVGSSSQVPQFSPTSTKKMNAEAPPSPGAIVLSYLDRHLQDNKIKAKEIVLGHLDLQVPDNEEIKIKEPIINEKQEMSTVASNNVQEENKPIFIAAPFVADQPEESNETAHIIEVEEPAPKCVHSKSFSNLRAYNRPAQFDSPSPGKAPRSWKPKGVISVKPANLEDDEDKKEPMSTTNKKEEEQEIPAPAPEKYDKETRALTANVKEGETEKVEEDSNKSFSKLRAFNRPGTFDSPGCAGSSRKSWRPKRKVSVESATLGADPKKEEKESSEQEKPVETSAAEIAQIASIKVAFEESLTKNKSDEIEQNDEGDDQQQVEEQVTPPEPQRIDVGKQDIIEAAKIIPQAAETSNRVVALVSLFPDSLYEHMPRQKRAMAIMKALDIEPQFVDGSNPNLRDKRENLFEISGIRGVYPQFFIVNEHGNTKFFGDFEKIEVLNDCGTLADEIKLAYLEKPSNSELYRGC